MATTRRGPQTAATGTIPPSADWLTATEMRTLTAVCDTLIPSVAPPTGEDDPHGFYARSASDMGVARLMAETLAPEPPEKRAQFKQLLGLLGNPAVCLMLAGTPQGFARMSPAQREKALRTLSTSPVPQFRQGFQTLKQLAAFIFYSAPVAEDGTNPNWPALAFPAPPAPPSAEEAPKTIRTLPVTGDLTLTADVVIVGSGAGGGVVAGELAAAGKDVVVLEKGGYYNEADFTGREAEMMPQLYLRRGLLSTADLGVSVLAGSCLGGGTVVNWSTSLRTPPEVLDEWEREHGIEGATSAEFARGFDEVSARIGVNTDDSAPNANNAALQRGCEALGYEWKVIPRNASDCRQRCGACGYGCPFGRKQSTMKTYLQDASDRGARMIVRCQVERVLLDGGRVTGVEGWAEDGATGTRHRVVVRSPVVVVAAGAVESPALLLRSGLANPNIGRHLRLHPVSALAAYYAEPVETWVGSLQTIYAPHFSHLKGTYGIWFEVSPTHPGLSGLSTPWQSGADHKRLMRRAPFSASFISLTRDTGEGHVTLDRHGDPVLHYWPNMTDRQHLVKGLQELTRIAFAGGAVGLGLTHTPPLTLESPDGKPGGVTGAQIQRFGEEIERRGIAANRTMVFSAHQMGTCRMGADARTSVADSYGQVHGVRGLFVADASTCPTALGVNPMLTTMALAYRVAQRVKSGT